MNVIGLDLSLTSTGVAGWTGTAGWTDRIRSTATPAGPLERLRLIRARIADYVKHSGLVVIEGPSYGSPAGAGAGGYHERAGLWWMVVDHIDALGGQWMQVPPTTLKKYATGKGNAKKDEVLAAAVKRFPAIDVRGNDQADALWLTAIGADLLGAPMLELPKLHRDALAKLTLPEGIAR